MTTLAPASAYDLAVLAELIGKLPGGDIPAAWYFTNDEQNIAAHDKYWAAYRDWHKAVTDLAAELGFELGSVRFSGVRNDTLRGFYTDVLPNGWRRDPQGFILPRRKTKAERENPTAQKFAGLTKIPKFQPIGMPDILWLPGSIYSLHLRRAEGRALLALWGADPDRSEDPFEVDETLWERLPISVYHLLREMQAAS